MKVNVLIARFPFGNQENPDILDWLVPTVLAMKDDKRIGHIDHTRVDDTPITMGRNRVLKEALDRGYDYVLMVDSDMKPDLYAGSGMPRFWDEAFPFMLQHDGPCCVGAPYCGPPPDECVYVFQWTRKEEQNPNPDLCLQMFGREQVALKKGIEEVAALPTGLILIDMRGVQRLPAPWFDYEYTDQYHSAKASTEDVYFTRNLSLAGVKQYVTWDCWAGHHKRKLVGRPTLLRAETVAQHLEDCILRRRANVCHPRANGHLGGSGGRDGGPGLLRAGRDGSLADPQAQDPGAEVGSLRDPRRAE